MVLRSGGHITLSRETAIWRNVAKALPVGRKCLPPNSRSTPALVPSGGNVSSVRFVHRTWCPLFRQETSTLSPTRNDSGGETLGVWSASDLMWELSPGMRAMVGEERPLSSRDVAELFYGLLPRERKVKP